MNYVKIFQRLNQLYSDCLKKKNNPINTIWQCSVQHCRIMYVYSFKTAIITCIHIMTWNHEFDVCYLNIACTLSRRFHGDVVEISVTVTDYILWNVHTVGDLPCFIIKPNQAYVSRFLHHHCWGNRMMWNHVIVPKPVAQCWILCYVHQLDSPRIVITNFKKRTTENCAYFMRYHVL